MSGAPESGDYPVYEFSGYRRDGRGVVGRTHEHPSTLVARLFKQRWQLLTVHVEGDETEVGGITHDPNTDKRVWWSEATADA